MMRMMVWNWGMQRMWKASAVRCCHLYLQCMLPRCLCCHRRDRITPFRPAYFVTQWTIEGWTSLHISCSIQHLFSLFQVVHFVWYALPVAWYGIIGMQHCNPPLQYSALRQTVTAHCIIVATMNNGHWLKYPAMWCCTWTSYFCPPMHCRKCTL